MHCKDFVFLSRVAAKVKCSQQRYSHFTQLLPKLRLCIACVKLPRIYSDSFSLFDLVVERRLQAAVVVRSPVACAYPNSKAKEQTS